LQRNLRHRRARRHLARDLERRAGRRDESGQDWGGAGAPEGHDRCGPRRGEGHRDGDGPREGVPQAPRGGPRARAPARIAGTTASSAVGHFITGSRQPKKFLGRLAALKFPFTQLRFRPAQRPRSGKHGVKPAAVRRMCMQRVPRK
jgi:hypothetical protein